MMVNARRKAMERMAAALQAETDKKRALAALTVHT